MVSPLGHDVTSDLTPFTRKLHDNQIWEPSIIEDLALEISARATGRSIGELQNRRAHRKRLKRIPKLFNRQTIGDAHAYHVGGRSELQFNIGYEKTNGKNVFRHGVAFALVRDRTVLDISIFRERIQRFNKYLDDYPKAFNDLLMWYRIDHEGEPKYAPAPIPDSLVRDGVFIMLGKICPMDAIDIETVLDDFDRLMPLYEFVEGGGEVSARGNPIVKTFEWIPGNSARVLRTRFEWPERHIDRPLQHNKLQKDLYSHLCEIHGDEHVSGEQDCGIGKFIDVAVRNGNAYIYYEIKMGYSSQSCIREAFGQLMEYSFWPGSQEACKLVVVGESPLDDEAREYLDRLRNKFSLPLTYQEFDGKRLVS